MGGLHLVPVETLMVVAMYCMCTSIRDTIYVVSSMWYTGRAACLDGPSRLSESSRTYCVAYGTVRKYLYQHLSIVLDVGN